MTVIYVTSMPFSQHSSRCTTVQQKFGFEVLISQTCLNKWTYQTEGPLQMNITQLYPPQLISILPNNHGAPYWGSGTNLQNFTHLIFKNFGNLVLALRPRPKNLSIDICVMKKIPIFTTKIKQARWVQAPYLLQSCGSQP